MEPFKCEFVPVNAIVALCIKNRQLVEYVWQLDRDYIASFKTENRHTWRTKGKLYRTHPMTKVLKELLRLQFNYTDSTIACGDVINRTMKIYGKHREKIFNATERAEI